MVRSKKVKEGVDLIIETYQVCERIQLLSHQAALSPPPRHLAIHEIKKQAERHKG